MAQRIPRPATCQGTSAGQEAPILSRRTLLRTAASAAATMALASCGNAFSPAATAGSGGATAVNVTPQAQPTVASAANASASSGGPVKRGGTLTEASVLANPGWDIHLANAIVAGHIMVYECLLRYDLVDEKAATFELRPGLAESWEQPDPQTIVLHLRKGVKFHDGSDFNADVVRWNLERIQKTPQALSSTQFAVLDTVEAMDPATVRLKLKTPNAAFLFVLSDGNRNSAMISQAQFEKIGAQQFNQNPSGTGSMRVKQYIQDDRAILEPFPGYWEKGADGKVLPYLDQLVSRYIPDLATALVELKSGGVDIVREMPPRDVASSRSNPDLVFQDFPWAATEYLNLGFNLEKPPFNNPKVRQAVLYGTDREAMIKAVGFGAGAAMYYNYWLPGSLGYDPSIMTYKYDADKAKQLLMEAGVPNGFDFEMKYIQREPDTTAIQLQQQVWDKLGIRAKIVGLERLAWVEDFKVKNFVAGVWRGNMPLDPDLMTQVQTNGATNFSHFSDPDIDQWMKQGGALLDPKQRAPLYSKVIARIQEQAYIGSGFQVPNIYGYHKNVHGLRLLFNGIDYRAAWKG